MPNYLPAALHNLQHTTPTLPQDPPHAWKTPEYGATVQWADNSDKSPVLPPQFITLVQQIIRNLLYYAISVGPTMLAALVSIVNPTIQGHPEDL